MSVDIAEKVDQKIKKELMILSRFVHIYCSGKHKDRHKARFVFEKLDDVLQLDMKLCEQCSKLLSHGIVMRIKCPIDPKPMCKKCVTQCYHEFYREQIVNVMKYAGMKMILRGRVDMLYHYFF